MSKIVLVLTEVFNMTCKVSFLIFKKMAPDNNSCVLNVVNVVLLPPQLFP